MNNYERVSKFKREVGYKVGYKERIQPLRRCATCRHSVMKLNSYFVRSCTIDADYFGVMNVMTYGVCNQWEEKKSAVTKNPIK